MMIVEYFNGLPVSFKFLQARACWPRTNILSLLVYAGRIWITSAEGATAPETLRQKDLHINIKSGERCLRTLAEGITISGKRTEGHH